MAQLARLSGAPAPAKKKNRVNNTSEEDQIVAIHEKLHGPSCKHGSSICLHGARALLHKRPGDGHAHIDFLLPDGTLDCPFDACGPPTWVPRHPHFDMPYHPPHPMHPRMDPFAYHQHPAAHMPPPPPPPHHHRVVRMPHGFFVPHQMPPPLHQLAVVQGANVAGMPPPGPWCMPQPAS